MISPIRKASLFRPWGIEVQTFPLTVEIRIIVKEYDTSIVLDHLLVENLLKFHDARVYHKQFLHIHLAYIN